MVNGEELSKPSVIGRVISVRCSDLRTPYARAVYAAQELFGEVAEPRPVRHERVDANHDDDVLPQVRIVHTHAALQLTEFRFQTFLKNKEK